jgi:MoaD family protein
MRIKISYDSYLTRKITGTGSEELSLEEGSSIRSAIGALKSKYGDNLKRVLIDEKSGALKAIILVNGLSVNDMEYVLSQSDEIDLLPLATGG